MTCTQNTSVLPNLTIGSKINTLKIAAFLVLLVGSFSKPVIAASFDCAKASTSVEVAICSDEQLSDLDKQLARVYKQAGPDQKTQQRAWLKYRNTCGSNVQCLVEVYKQRISVLQGVGAAPKALASADSSPLIPATECAVITMASKNDNDVITELKKYRDFEPVAIRSNNGYTAAAVGIYPKAEGNALVQKLKAEGIVPKDAYCGNSERYVRILYPNADYSSLDKQTARLTEKSTSIPNAESSVASLDTAGPDSNTKQSPAVNSVPQPDASSESAHSVFTAVMAEEPVKSSAEEPLTQPDNTHSVFTAATGINRSTEEVATKSEKAKAAENLKPCFVYSHNYPVRLEKDPSLRKDAEQFENGLVRYEGVAPSYLITDYFVAVYWKTFVEDPSSNDEVRSKFLPTGRTMFMKSNGVLIGDDEPICDERVNSADTLASWDEVERAHEQTAQDRLAQAAPPPPFENDTDDGALRDAYGFMLGGDKGWDVADRFDIKSCIVRYSTDVGPVRVVITHDLNRVQWKSASVKLVDGQLNFYVSCQGDCLEQRGYTDDPKMAQSFLLDEVTQDFIQFPLLVSRDRFERALTDVTERCPGAKSKY